MRLGSGFWWEGQLGLLLLPLVWLLVWQQQLQPGQPIWPKPDLLAQIMPPPPLLG